MSQRTGAVRGVPGDMEWGDIPVLTTNNDWTTCCPSLNATFVITLGAVIPLLTIDSWAQKTGYVKRVKCLLGNGQVSLSQKLLC